MLDTAASIFFRSLFTEGFNGFEKLATLVTDGAEENEWMEFKEAGFFDAPLPSDHEEKKREEKRRDDVVKNYWSQNLSAFSNSGGGLLIWGISAPKTRAEKLSLPRSATDLAERLKQLQNTAVEPLVPGVEVRPVFEPNRETGFVVCYIPNSIFSPHCAKYSAGGYYQRAHDSNFVMRPDTLRRMFHPHTMPRLVPIVRLHAVRSHEDLLHVSMRVHLQNCGAASARDTFIKAAARSDRVFTAHHARYWDDKSSIQEGYSCLTSIHPGETVPFLTNWTHPGGYQSQADLPKTIRVTFSIYCENASALFADLIFDEADLALSLTAPVDRRAIVSPLDIG